METSKTDLVGTGPRRALALTLLMLVGTTGVAGVVTWSRRSITLGERISPQGWRISFRPPGRWVQPGVELGKNTIVFEDPTRGRDRRWLVFSRDPHPRHGTAEGIAGGCLQDLTNPASGGLLVPSVRTYPTHLGPFPGATIEDAQTGTTVSAAFVEEEAYCVALISGRDRGGGDRDLARLVVEAIEPAF